MQRRLAVILGFLILGAIINIAVAWGLAAFGPVSDSITRSVETQPSAIEWWIKGAPENFRQREPGYPNLAYVEDPPQVILARTVGMEVTSMMSRYGQRYRNDGSAYIWQSYRLRCGWPFLSMQALQWAKVDRMVELTELAIELPQINWSDSHRQWNYLSHTRLIPLRPVLPGFLMNTLFYAALCWLLLAAPFALRRALRRRRGLCVRCAYPVGTSERCTECGAALP